ncbi:uncharacterized protein MEPE_05265 [Melanopsichium pennsylvanicum]|uniref:CCHC-type domain-containing protein n=1 Tax=Melanopsichium pennsylvanicum TaxID=63383 RepID=A0AAJ4XRF7_9BASI|nr:uncharacterized protein MEPE_05265 [Melanopsichium pennsylvanicum]
MTQCHDGINAGHVGQDATLDLARRHYWWPGMAAWVADYVASCPVCARYKTPRHKPYGLLQPLSTPERPWGSISLDFIEGLPSSSGFDSILVVVDRLSKLAVVMPTHKTATSKDTVELLQAHQHWGVPVLCMLWVGPTTFNSDACRVCGKTGHWQRNCPDAKPTVYPARPSGPQMRAHVVLESEKPQDGSPEEGDGAEDHREDNGGLEDHFDPNLFADDHDAGEPYHEDEGNDLGAMQ